jgi:hypothetical protein
MSYNDSSRRVGATTSYIQILERNLASFYDSHLILMYDNASIHTAIRSRE